MTVDDRGKQIDGAAVRQTPLTAIPLNPTQIKATALYTLLSIVPLLSQVILLPVNTRYLTPNDFGITTLANVCRTYLAVVILFGIDAALERFYFDCRRDADALKRLMGNVFVGLVATNIVCYAIGAIGGPRLFEWFFGESLSFGSYGWFIFGTTSAQTVGAILLSYYRISENALKYARVALLSFLLPTAGAVIGITVFHGGALGSVAGRCIGQIAVAVPLCLVLFRDIGVSWRLRGVRDLFSYGTPLLVGGLLGQSNLVLDKILMAATYGLSDLGVYSAANTIAYVVPLAVAGLWKATSPDVYRLLVDPPANVSARIEKYAETMVLLGVVCVIALMAAIDPVVRILASPSYRGAAHLVPLLACAYLVRPLYFVFATNVYFHKRTRLITALYGASLTTMALFFVCVGRHLGVVGVGLSVAVGEVSQFAYTVWLGRSGKRWSLSPASQRRITVLVVMPMIVVAANYTYLYQSGLRESWINLAEACAMWVVVVSLYRRRLMDMWRDVANSLRSRT